MPPPSRTRTLLDLPEQLRVRGLAVPWLLLLVLRNGLRANIVRFYNRPTWQPQPLHSLADAVHLPHIRLTTYSLSVKAELSSLLLCKSGDRIWFRGRISGGGATPSEPKSQGFPSMYPWVPSGFKPPPPPATPLSHGNTLFKSDPFRPRHKRRIRRCAIPRSQWTDTTRSSSFYKSLV